MNAGQSSVPGFVPRDSQNALQPHPPTQAGLSGTHKLCRSKPLSMGKNGFCLDLAGSFPKRALRGMAVDATWGAQRDGRVWKLGPEEWVCLCHCGFSDGDTENCGGLGSESSPQKTGACGDDGSRLGSISGTN